MHIWREENAMVTCHKLLLILSIIILTILASCSGETIPETPTVTVPPTATFTPSPTYTPTPTFTPTATPTQRLPVAPQTQMPVPDQSISADNLDQVVELARWGKGVITDAIFSPDGKQIAVGTTLGVSLYQADTLDEILYFETGASVNSVVFSPDGETLATGLNDNTAKLWKTSDGTLLKSFDGHVDEKPKKDSEKPEITSVAFSPDGSQVAGGSSDGTVSLWQVLDGILVNTFKNHTDTVSSVLFSPDGETIFSASRDGKVHMINIADNRIIHTFLGVGIIDASISNDGKILATYDAYYYYQGGIKHTEDKLILWDVASGEKMDDVLKRGFIENKEITTNLAFSPNGQFIAAAFPNRMVKIWDITNDELKYTFDDLKPNSWYYLNDFTLSFSPDSQFLLLAGANVIGVWNAQKGTLISNSTIKSEEIVNIAQSPDMETMAAIEGANVNLIQVSDGSLIPIQEKIQSNGSLAFSPDGRTLLISMFGATAQLWSLSDQSTKKSFKAEDGYSAFGGVAFSPDGQIVGLGTRGTGEVEILQVADGTLIKKLFVDTYAFIQSVQFSPDGNYLAASTWTRIRLFQLPNGQLLQTYNRGPSIAFAPDSTLLAGGSADKTITVWKLPKGDVFYVIKDCPDEVWALAFSSNGKYLIAGYYDGTIDVFLMSDGTLLRRWKGHSELVSDLLITSDGKYLISASYDGTIRMWGIKP